MKLRLMAYGDQSMPVHDAKRNLPRWLRRYNQRHGTSYRVHVLYDCNPRRTRIYAYLRALCYDPQTGRYMRLWSYGGQQWRKDWRAEEPKTDPRR